ncbi:beta-glucoside-specific PTS transporter subunit IIABC [Floccifex sp.]|uniref:beta-glucoside-specific PTS transporter subunit IIABC n=1 Tax=Floccifex sp. TaxID=2815810 RepID=UPI002A764B73|nr:beta-glucoside-specific PTS transporter subunit IIABC [Floccifex sp.]MDY2959026.1 beta-glucoside-specific PTS transporter subunit IIABC [Floccifex sp.]
MKYENLAREILSAVGGKKNIASLTHCMTRLRFTFNDNAKVDEQKLENIEGVVSLVKSGGQYQVVIGTHVHDVYLDVCELAGIKEDEPIEEKKKKGFVSSLIGAITGCIGPIIPVLVGCGLGRCLLMIISMLGLANAETSYTYYIFNFVFDAGYYFLPVFTAVAAAKHFKCNPFIAAVLGAALVHPNWTATTSPIIQEVGKMFSVIPVFGISYTSSFLPAILVTWAMSKVEHGLNKVTPQVVKNLVVPLGTLLIMIPIEFTILAPLMGIISIYLGKALLWCYNTLGMFGLAILCFVYPWVVTCGMHAPLAVAGMQLLAANGYDPISRTLTLTANMAQGAACIAVGIKTKNRDLKETSFSSAVTALIGGITEPAIYGVTLKLKKPMIAVSIGSMVAGLYAGFCGLKAYAFMSPSLVNFAMWAGPDGSSNLINAFVTIAISMVVTFIMTLVLGWEEPEEKTQIQKKSSNVVNTVSAPVTGKVVALKDVNDKAFSSEALGKGIAIIPEEGKVYAPEDGIVSALFDTKHAIGITTKDGVEILIHIGIDTVNLAGKGFTSHVAQNQQVKKGDCLVEFDLDEIKKENYDTTTMVVITNTSNYLEVIPTKEGKVQTGDALLTVM